MNGFQKFKLGLVLDPLGDRCDGERPGKVDHALNDHPASAGRGLLGQEFLIQLQLRDIQIL